MRSVLRISDATVIGMHAMMALAANPARVLSTAQIAGLLKVSEAHLSKVLQRLGRGGFVNATRGPRGGFSLARPAEDVTMLAIYEFIEGPLYDSSCLLSLPTCDGAGCCFKGLMSEVRDLVQKHLGDRRLSDMMETFTVGDALAQRHG